MIIMDENYMAHLKTLSRDALLTEYMAANGATTKGYSAIVGPDGTLLQKRPLEPITIVDYANLVSPCRSAYSTNSDCLTVTYKRFADIGGMLPVAVSSTEKLTNCTHITVFSIRFDRRAPGYSAAKATAAMNRLCYLEHEWCAETTARLRQRGAKIYEYRISFQTDEAALMNIDEVKPQPYIESIFSARHYDDETSVSIVWEDTEYGWLPVISSIDNVVNYGFLITAAQGTNEKSPDAAPHAVL